MHFKCELGLEQRMRYFEKKRERKKMLALGRETERKEAAFQILELFSIRPKFFLPFGRPLCYSFVLGRIEILRKGRGLRKNGRENPNGYDKKTQFFLSSAKGKSNSRGKEREGEKEKKMETGKRSALFLCFGCVSSSVFFFSRVLF